MKPEISVIIPFKNVELYIADCVVSIMQQTFDNWEAIFVDDSSTDKSFGIVEDYKNVDSRIILVQNTGTGIIDALKTGYELSSGCFITRMDSDDIMSEDRFELMRQDLLRHGKRHIALGLVRYFRLDGLNNGYKSYEQWLNHLSINGSNFSEIYKECVIPSPCWMVFREDFELCGGFNSEVYPEDYDLAFRFLKHGFKCIPTNSVLLHWRDYGERTSRNDSNYKENSFLPLKMHYFLDLHYNKEKQLIIWGVGNKGKVLAKYLTHKKVPFKWVCDNPKKIGKDIYGVRIESFKTLLDLNNFQCVVSVANKTEQTVIKDYLTNLDLKPMKDYFFFC